MSKDKIDLKEFAELTLANSETLANLGAKFLADRAVVVALMRYLIERDPDLLPHLIGAADEAAEKHGERAAVHSRRLVGSLDPSRSGSLQ